MKITTIEKIIKENLPKIYHHQVSLDKLAYFDLEEISKENIKGGYMKQRIADEFYKILFKNLKINKQIRDCHITLTSTMVICTEEDLMIAIKNILDEIFAEDSLIPRFNVGDKVFIIKNEKTTEICPHCDGNEFIYPEIKCTKCRNGIAISKENNYNISEVVIKKVFIDADGVKYTIDNMLLEVKQTYLYYSIEEAQNKLHELIKERKL